MGESHGASVSLALDVMPELLDRAWKGVNWPHESLIESHQDGCAEAWVAQVLGALLVATGQSVVLETGGFLGTTSAWLALVLDHMGGGTLIIAEIDSTRAEVIQKRLDDLPLKNVARSVIAADIKQVIQNLTPEYVGFAFVDDDHAADHVAEELELLFPKMAPNGLICLHDVWGITDLQKIVRHYGGYSINLPRLGPAGGLGIIQV